MSKPLLKSHSIQSPGEDWIQKIVPGWTGKINCWYAQALATSSNVGKGQANLSKFSLRLVYPSVPL